MCSVSLSYLIAFPNLIYEPLSDENNFPFIGKTNKGRFRRSEFISSFVARNRTLLLKVIIAIGLSSICSTNFALHHGGGASLNRYLI